MGGSDAASGRSEVRAAWPQARVLAVDTHWFSAAGGINTFNRRLCAALAAAGAEVCCLVPAATEAELDNARAAGVMLVSALPAAGTTEENALFLPPDLPAGFVPNLIIGHGRVTGPAARAQRQFYPGASHIYVMHTSPDEIEWHKPGRDSPARTAEEKMEVERHLAREATAALAVGPWLIEVLRNELRSFPNRPQTREIVPGFDAVDLEPRDPPGLIKEILVLGRMEDYLVKGVDIAARALGYARTRLGQESAHIKLLLRGVPDADAKKLHKKVREWAAWRSLVVAPRSYAVDSVRLEEDLRRATLVLMPSRAEGYGLVGVEAVAAGTPVLISERSGLARHLRVAAPTYANQVIVPVEDREKDDARRWGEAIVGVLGDPAAAFANAESLARHMRTTATWAMAARTVLDLAPHDIHAATVPPGARSEWSAARRGAASAPIPTAWRDPLSVLVCAGPEQDSSLLIRLRTELANAAPHVVLWTEPASRDDEAAEKTLRRADAVLVLVTRLSARADLPDPARRQVAAARRRDIPLIALLADPGVAVPDDLARLPVLDVTKESDSGWRRLLRMLDELGIAEVPAGPEDVPGDAPPLGTVDARTPRPRLINEMPLGSSATFVDREEYVRPLCELINDPATRVVMLEGRDGIGKTAMLRRLWDHPDQVRPELRLDGVVYLSGRGYRWITTATLLTDIARVADSGSDVPAGALDEQRPWRRRLDDVLAAVRGMTILVMVDDGDDLFDRGECKDRELRELILTMVTRTDHNITFIVCVQRRQAVFMGDLRRLGRTLPLDRGLPKRWAKSLLRELDCDDLGLANAPEAQLDRLYNLTGGHPRSLELVVGLLRTTALSVDVLADHLDGARDVPETLLTLMFEELTRTEERVVQALAIYARPVSPKAVDHLLRDLVQQPDSSRPLNRLTERNLVHRRGACYYLPPVPDAEFILATLLDEGAMSSGLDKPTLWQRAAEYFHTERVRPVRTVEDLWPQFGEIELHLRIGDATTSTASFRTALELMDDIDDKYLTGWGQSHILAPWRRTLQGRLHAPVLEGRNLSYLVAARQQQDGHRDDIQDLKAALQHAADAHDEVATHVVGEQLANALFDAGLITEAAEMHRGALEAFHNLGLPRYEAGARMELAICLIKGGAFEEAERELRSAWQLVAPLPLDDHHDIRVRILHNAGWLAGQLGQDDEAVSRLDKALDLVGRGNDADTGALRNAKAAVLLYSQDPVAALEQAEAAAEIGLRRGDYTLSREAHVNMALALLLIGQHSAAMHAADAAAGYSDTPQALGALGIQGLVAFHNGEDDKAQHAFLKAFSKSDERFSRDQGDYQMLDARGLILCGLALLRERDVEDATRAYEAARAITMAPGVLRRNRVHLGQFGPHADDAILLEVRRAASGRAAVDEWS